MVKFQQQAGGFTTGCSRSGSRDRLVMTQRRSNKKRPGNHILHNDKSQNHQRFQSSLYHQIQRKITLKRLSIENQRDRFLDDLAEEERSTQLAQDERVLGEERQRGRQAQGD